MRRRQGVALLRTSGCRFFLLTGRRDGLRLPAAGRPYSLLVVPGAVKDSALTRNIFNLGWQALQQMGREQNWHCLQAEALALSTGCEGFMALQADAQRVKDCAMQLEVQQPIGRLWDIDVLDPEGRILSRRDLGLAERRCLLCSQPAKICARQRRHSSEQLLQEMERMLNDALSTR